MTKRALPGLLALTLAGCAADYVTSNSAPVNLYIAGITGSNGPVLASDVDPPTADFVTLNLAVRTKNPNQPIAQRVAMAVTVERYDVRYFRSDGRNTEGVDVPHRIGGAINFLLDVEASGTSALLVEVVRAQAKLESPLRNLRTQGGAIRLTSFAEVTIYGHTIAGEAVSASGTVQIDFGDF